MKYFYTLAALAALVAAQDIPECATDCIRDAAEAETDCTFGDWDCLCIEANRNAVTEAGTACVVAACGVDTALNEVVPAITAICTAAGGGGGGSTPPPTDDDDEETTPPPTDDDDEETTPPPAEETTPPPAEETTPPPADDDDETVYPPPEEEEESSVVPPPVPSPTNNGTIPEPSHEEAGAGKVGFMGVAAMVGLAALAL